MKVLRLKNGTEEVEPLVITAMMSLELLFTTKPLHAYELVQLCRNPSHPVFGRMGEDLVGLALAERRGNGFGVHESVRNVVLSAVLGDGLEMTLGNPVA